jgi:type IV fimbrial biogenesis protein FimT
MKRKTTGFTLIELMVTIAVAVILLSIGIPGFQEMLTTNRTATVSNEFVTSMSIARSEAIKRHTNVVVTATNGSDTNNEWGPGWKVWADLNSNGSQDGNDPDIKTVTAITGSIALDSAGGSTSFTYSGSGLVNTAQNLYLCNKSGNPSRWIEVTATGRVSVWQGSNAATDHNPDNYACP